MGQNKSDLDLDKVWCVVPVFNESRILKTVLIELKQWFPNVLCVDDGSGDHSFEIAGKYSTVALRHCSNLGQGAALETGFAYLRRCQNVDYVVTFDSDGQHLASDAFRLVEELAGSDLDAVFATRFQESPSTKIPYKKRIVLQSVVFLRRLFIRSQLTDTNNGLRAFRAEVLNQFSISCSQMAHALEIESKIHGLGLKYREVPVEILYTEYSMKKGQSVWNAINIMKEFYVR